MNVIVAVWLQREQKVLQCHLAALGATEKKLQTSQGRKWITKMAPEVLITIPVIFKGYGRLHTYIFYFIACTFRKKADLQLDKIKKNAKIAICSLHVLPAQSAAPLPPFLNL